MEQDRAILKKCRLAFFLIDLELLSGRQTKHKFGYLSSILIYLGLPKNVRVN